MLFTTKSPTQKRIDLKKALQQNRLLQAPGVYSPMIAMEVEKLGFPLVYISGAVLAADLGLPDIGLTTMSEVCERGRQIARVVNLPCIIDADTGFGEPLNIARCVQLFEDAGLAGMHLEDQIQPKRCGHLDNKILCSKEQMVQKIKIAIQSRKDKNFLIIARTDARAIEGIKPTLERIQAYKEAGAEMIFPEAMQDVEEFTAVKKAVNIPMLANMTEFGKSDLLEAKELQKIGFQVVIYPVSLWRIAVKSSVSALLEIKKQGHQKKLIPNMQTRKELYESLQYEKYNQFDKNIFNFQL